MGRLKIPFRVASNFYLFFANLPQAETGFFWDFEDDNRVVLLIVFFRNQFVSCELLVVS